MKARPESRQVTAELLARYDRPGPRYTSYPTAVEFSDAVDTAVYEARLAQADSLGQAPLSVYMHLPFCATRCHFCGCHVVVSPKHENAVPYLTSLHREIELVAERLEHRRQVSQLHLGGGTPTYFSPAQLVELLRRFRDRFQFTQDAEVAIEVDPRVTTREHVEALSSVGFNRISMGVQDFSQKVQEAIGRSQTLEQAASLVEHARANGFAGINIDLVYGLPHQTPDSFERTVETAISLKPDRLAVYSFAYLPWLKSGMKKLPEEALPDRDTKFELFGIAREGFLAAGFEPIGMDHFARPDDELALAKRAGRLRRNFQGYSVIPAEDVIGLGVSAIGDVRGAYVQNAKKLSVYQKSIAAGRLPVELGIARTKDDEVRRDVIHRLMCNFKLSIPAIEAAHGIDFRKYFQEDLRRLEQEQANDMVLIGEEIIEATPTGELFVRNLALCFDRYWREKHENNDRPTFSRTV